MPDINLNQFQKHVQNFMNAIQLLGSNKLDEQSFEEKVTNDKSIFEMLDQNRDGKISQDEIETVCQADSDNDGIVTENELRCMQQMKFFARRGIDKWFTIDINRDGHISNVENKTWVGFRSQELYQGLNASMTNEQLAELYNMEEIIDENQIFTLQCWLDVEIENLIQDARSMYGIELNEKQIIALKSEQKKQLNTWLFKTGDNAAQDAPLYNSLNVTAYTRLVTTKQTVSCCGGDIVPPPTTDDKTQCGYVFSKLDFSVNELEEINKQAEELNKQVKELRTKLESGEITQEEYNKQEEEYNKQIEKLYKLSNNAEEVKNRLAWAMFKTPTRVLEIQEQINIERKEVEDKVKQGEMTQEEADEMAWPIWERMSDEEYAQYHEQYQTMRNMKANDFRELLKPGNEQMRTEFERNSSMTVQQIVDYIDIVEQQIGIGNFDNDNWSVSSGQYYQITLGINGTVGDEDKLQGKTRSDVPENRQNLLRFLEEKGWLSDQFKF